MAKTFEALMEAERANQLKPEEVKVFALRPKSKPAGSINFTVPFQVAAEYERMKHYIASADAERKIKTILFSSATEGEGNTTVLINLALTLASGGEQVLVVDANLRNPSLHDLLNVEQKNGLTEWLLQNSPLQDVIKKTEKHNMAVITSGCRHSNPPAIFESRSFANAMDQLKARADWVLCDSPPITLYNDACALAAKMDGAVLVVQAEKTRWQVVHNARQQIERGQANILGVVLNRRKMYIPGWAYKML